jgi:archaellum biogenesis ATPase FlaH
MSEYYEENEIRKALQLMKPDGQLFEIRLLRKNPKRTISGYFRTADKMIEEFQKLDLRGYSSYITLNSINPDCYSRAQSDKFLQSPENTTSDGDINGYDWLFVDLDPVRSAGISSSDAELEESRKLSCRVMRYLKEIGFADPIISMSGNGYHLLYRIYVEATEERKELIRKCLAALDMLFSTDKVKVDTANFNQSRICKLYGTLAQKGTGTTDRPHRMSRVITSQPAEATDIVHLQKLANMLPKEQAPAKYNNYNPKQFDIETWMADHGVRWQSKKNGAGYIKYILDECPFDPNHKAPDSCITIGQSGAIGFHCFHDHCQGKTWRDVRLLYEPDAYDQSFTASDDARIEAGWKEHKKHSTVLVSVTDEDPIELDEDPAREQPQEEPEKPVFLTARMILDMPDDPIEFIRSGCEGIDNRIGGLQKGYLSLVSGLRGGSKSTWLSQVALQAVTDDHIVIFYSGELTSKNFMKWMWLQAAGRKYTKQVPHTDSRWYVEREIKQKIADWLGDRFLLYENDYGNNFLQLVTRIKHQIVRTGAELVILDNLMSVDINDLSHDKWDAQKEFATILRNLARDTRAHIMFVAHPRKTVGLLRLQDVSGSSDLANTVDNAFIVHRNNIDFQKLSKDTFRWPEEHEAYQGTNVIEIAKDRDTGFADVFIPLWYESESKRLNNQYGELIKYGWEPDFTDMDEEVPF